MKFRFPKEIVKKKRVHPLNILADLSLSPVASSQVLLLSGGRPGISKYIYVVMIGPQQQEQPPTRKVNANKIPLPPPPQPPQQSRMHGDPLPKKRRLGLGTQAHSRARRGFRPSAPNP